MGPMPPTPRRHAATDTLGPCGYQCSKVAVEELAVGISEVPGEVVVGILPGRLPARDPYHLRRGDPLIMGLEVGIYPVEQDHGPAPRSRLRVHGPAGEAAVDVGFPPIRGVADRPYRNIGNPLITLSKSIQRRHNINFNHPLSSVPSSPKHGSTQGNGMGSWKMTRSGR